jgi:hypothetical protein
MHRDLPPEAIALRLGGTLMWKGADEGMWMALIRFNRRIEADDSGAASQQVSGSASQ